MLTVSLLPCYILVVKKLKVKVNDVNMPKSFLATILPQLILWLWSEMDGF